MFKWLLRMGLLAILGWIGYATYDWYMAGHHTRPEMPEGAFSLSYKNGLRGILVDVADERRHGGISASPRQCPITSKMFGLGAIRPPTRRPRRPPNSSRIGRCPVSGSRRFARLLRTTTRWFEV